MGQQVRFTDELRSLAGAKWEAVINHRFTDALAAGTIDRDVLARYLVQDHRFLDSFVVLLSSMVAAAPSLAARIPGCQFLALITGTLSLAGRGDGQGVDLAYKISCALALALCILLGLLLHR